MKEESENVGLKLNIQKTKIMASGPMGHRDIWDMANRWGYSRCEIPWAEEPSEP